MKRPAYIYLALLLASTMADANQRCNDRINSTAPVARFRDNHDGTATDTRTGLMWTRCALGFDYQYDPGLPDLPSCVPLPTSTYTWQIALQTTMQLNQQAGGYFGHTDWRVPNIKELASIIEARCIQPSINAFVFPNTPLGIFFSSSPYQNTPTFTSVRGIDFGSGWNANVSADNASTFASAYVRLVRTDH